MLLYRGAPALSPFRIERLLATLRRIEPAIGRLSVDFLHFVDTERALTPPEKAVLERLLDFDPRATVGPGEGQALFTVPRPGTISPWSSKATDIARVCGLAAVHRIERGKTWQILAERPLATDSLSALAALLFDPMTEAILTRRVGGEPAVCHARARPARAHRGLAGNRYAPSRARTRASDSRCRTTRSRISRRCSRGSGATRPTSR